LVKIDQLTDVSLTFHDPIREYAKDKLFENSLWDAEGRMLYLESNIAIMKTGSQTFRIAVWVILGIAILLSSLALTRPLQLVQDATAAPTALTTAVTATAEARSDAGSTDGIMLMGVVIMLIVIIPILLRRQSWSNGKRKNNLPLNK
jgi:hypothetical protein